MALPVVNSSMLASLKFTPDSISVSPTNMDGVTAPFLKNIEIGATKVSQDTSVTTNVEMATKIPANNINKSEIER